MSEICSGESIVQRINMMIPILLLFISEEVCNLGSSQYPWVVKDGTVEQIVVRGRRFLMKTGFEKSPCTEEAM